MTEDIRMTTHVKEKLTLKNVKEMMKPMTRENKRIETEKKNLHASILIKARQATESKIDETAISNLRTSVQKILGKGGTVPVDAQLQIFDGRIKEFDRRIEQLELRKVKNRGFLKDSEQRSLEKWQEEKAKYEKMKSDYLAEQTKEPELMEKSTGEPITLPTEPDKEINNGKSDNRNTDNIVREDG